MKRILRPLDLLEAVNESKHVTWAFPGTMIGLEDSISTYSGRYLMSPCVKSVLLTGLTISLDSPH